MSGGSPSRRGNGFLSVRLERALDLALRRRISLRDWTLSAGIVIVLHLSGISPIGWTMFAILTALALVALALWYWVFPRLEQTQALWMEIAMSAVTATVLLALVAASGGASSPYIFFYALLVVFVAAFVEHAVARGALIAISGLFALAPILYDWQDAVRGDFIPTIVIAVASWSAVGALIAFKRSSAVRAEFAARRLTYVDPLTGAGNRRALEEYALALTDAGRGFAVVVVRSDGVDVANLSAGHMVGDELLRRVVDAMREASGDADQVARLAGLEFAVILPGDDAADAQRWATRFQERLGLANATGQADLRVTAATGVGAGGSLTEMLRAAENEVILDRADRPAAVQLLPDASDRAARLRKHVAQSELGPKRSAIESVRAPTSVALVLLSAVALGVLLALTGGATSMFLGLAILVVGYFAVFGSRTESVTAAVSVAGAVLGAVVSRAPVSQVDQIRTLTVLATLSVIADSVQRNARTLEAAERRAGELSLVDPQTGLGNRNAFERDLVRILPRKGESHPSREERFEGLPAVLTMSCARWRSGTAGSGECDELLVRDVAERLRDAIGDDGSLYRIDSHDFAAILRAHHIQHVELVSARCEAMLAPLPAEQLKDEAAGSLSFRFGGALWSEGMSAADLAAAAVGDQTASGTLGTKVRATGSVS
jgi:diguanylate cyclase (GGDEF)-like protein